MISIIGVGAERTAGGAVAVFIWAQSTFHFRRRWSDQKGGPPECTGGPFFHDFRSVSG
jgi:hypothetical protein